jgi:hypothetical protein
LILGHWQLWALLALSMIGLLLSASAFQAGALSASLPVIDSAEPISAVLIGTLVFGEQLAASPAALAVQLAAAAAAVAGIIVLGRSPLAARAYSHPAGAPEPPARSLPELRPAPSAVASRPSDAHQRQRVKGGVTT